jgi:hypothetical protein
MPDTTIGPGSPIAEFIKQTVDQTKAGLGDWELKAPIILELSTVVSGKVGGGLNIQVINFGAKVEGEQVQKVRLAIGPKDEVAESKRKADIAQAEATRKTAEMISGQCD